MNGWIDKFRSICFFFGYNRENNKFKHYTNFFDEFSFTMLEDSVAEILGFTDISSEYLQHEIHGPNIVETYRKLAKEKSQTDGFYILLRPFAYSQVRDFGS